LVIYINDFDYIMAGAYTINLKEFIIEKKKK